MRHIEWKMRMRTMPVTTGGAGQRAADIWFQVILLLAMALPMLVLYAVSTLGPLLSRDLAFEPALLGYLVMSSFGLAAILSLWAGAIVDYLGSRYALMTLFCAIALAFALIAAVKSFYGLVMATGPDEFLGAGSGFRVSFVPDSAEPAHAGISLIEEGRMVDGTWKPGRRLNGDENDQGRYWRFSKDRIYVERSVVYRWE